MADLEQPFGSTWQFTEQEVFGTDKPPEQESIGSSETSWPEFFGEDEEPPEQESIGSSETSWPEFFGEDEEPTELASRVAHLSPQPKIGVQLGCKSGIALARHYFGDETLKRKPMLLAIFAGGGALLGHKLDTHVLPNYPSFRMVLEAVNSIV